MVRIDFVVPPSADEEHRIRHLASQGILIVGDSQHGERSDESDVGNGRPLEIVEEDDERFVGSSEDP